MGTWSIYISPEEEKLLKEKIHQIAQKKRWSFSQAVSGLLKEHLIEEPKLFSDEESWSGMAANAFFDGYPQQDSIYDAL